MLYIFSLFLAFAPLIASAQAAPSQNDSQSPPAVMPKVVIYTIPTCPGCDMAKSYLKSHGIPYQEVSIRGRPDLYNQMKRLAGGSPEESMTVPRIFINGKHIGGYLDLMSADLDGLKPKAYSQRRMEE